MYPGILGRVALVQHKLSFQHTSASYSARFSFLSGTFMVYCIRRNVCIKLPLCACMSATTHPHTRRNVCIKLPLCACMSPTTHTHIRTHAVCTEDSVAALLKQYFTA